MEETGADHSFAAKSCSDTLADLPRSHSSAAKAASIVSRAIRVGVPAVAQISSRKLCGSETVSLASGSLYLAKKA